MDIQQWKLREDKRIQDFVETMKSDSKIERTLEEWDEEFEYFIEMGGK